MNKEPELAVAKPKTLCRVCSIPEQISGVIINTEIGVEPAKEVAKLNNQIIGISDTPCSNCMSHLNDDELFILEANLVNGNIEVTGNAFIASDTILLYFNKVPEKQKAIRKSRLTYASSELLIEIQKLIRKSF